MPPRLARLLAAVLAAALVAGAFAAGRALPDGDRTVATGDAGAAVLQPVTDQAALPEEGLTDPTVPDARAAAGWAGGPERSDGLPDADATCALREELGR